MWCERGSQRPGQARRSAGCRSVDKATANLSNSTSPGCVRLAPVISLSTPPRGQTAGFAELLRVPLVTCPLLRAMGCRELSSQHQCLPEASTLPFSLPTSFMKPDDTAPAGPQGHVAVPWSSRMPAFIQAHRLFLRTKCFFLRFNRANPFL